MEHHIRSFSKKIVDKTYPQYADEILSIHSPIQHLPLHKINFTDDNLAHYLV